MTGTTLERRFFLLGSAALSAATLLGRRARAASVIVYNGTQLREAIAGITPGDTILLAPGNYGDVGSFTVARGGTAESPVLIQAQTRLTAQLRSRLTVDAPFVTVDGLTVEGEEVDLAGNGVHFTRCRVQGTGASGIEIKGGTGVRVSYCEVANYRGKAIMVRLGQRHDPVEPLIDHNHIHSSIGRGGMGEAIQLAQAMKDSNKRLRATVEHNLLQRTEGDSEAVSVKCSGNLIRFNTLEDSRANIVNRHGEDNVYEGNILDRSYSIVIHDRGNKLLGNRCMNSLQRRSIRVMGGNMGAGDDRQGGHPQAVDTYLCGNHADYLIVGDFFSGKSMPAINTTVANHTGPIVVRNAQGVNTSGPASSYSGPLRVGPGDVGPSAGGGRSDPV